MNGWAQDWYMYQPFGQTSQSKPSFDNWNRFRFTGREADETGLYYYRARYYAPDLGRFISEDPAGVDEFGNQYAYAGNNPIANLDPMGLANIPSSAYPLHHGGIRNPRPYHGDQDFFDWGLPGGFPATPNGVRRVVVGDFQFVKDVVGYSAHQAGHVLATLGNWLFSAPDEPPAGGRPGRVSSDDLYPRDRLAQDIISKEKKGSLKQQFPGEYLNETWGTIVDDAKNGITRAVKARKLLTNNRFNR